MSPIIFIYNQVLATSRSPYQTIAKEIGVSYYQDANDFCEEHPDIVILSTSILSLEDVVRTLPVQRLRRNTLFVDVLSVKEFPKALLLSTLPPEVDVLCTHPMFGPDSGKGSWKDLNFMYEKVRVADKDKNKGRVESFLKFFENEGCRMVEMTCEEHDRLAASTQFLTHTVGRTLGSMDLSRTSIDTKGYQSLMTLVENTTNDSFDLYYGLFLYNQNATQELERLERAFDSVKRELFGRLHDKLREQMFQVNSVSQPPASIPSSGGSSDEDSFFLKQQQRATTTRSSSSSQSYSNGSSSKNGSSATSEGDAKVADTCSDL